MERGREMSWLSLYYTGRVVDELDEDKRERNETRNKWFRRDIERGG